MRFEHPFQWLSTSAQKPAFVALLVLTLVLMVSLQLLGAPLQTNAAPSGIVSFEFAGDLNVARQMLDSWGQRGQVFAALNLGLDYLFLVAYGCSIGLGCMLVARNLTHRVTSLSSMGMFLSWAQLVAPVLDAVENYALIQLLLGSEREFWPTIAYWCALPKFLIVAAGLVYVVLGAALVLLARLRVDVP